MPGERREIGVYVVLENARAVRALEAVGEFLAELLEDQPWDTDAKKAVKAFRYAAKRLVVKESGARESQ